MNWFYIKLKYFSSSDRVLLINTLTEEKFNCLEDHEKKDLIFLFSKINNTTTIESLHTITTWVTEIFTYNYPFCMFKVNQGEDFKIILELEETVSGYALTARENITGKLVSDLSTQLTTSKFQEVIFNDLDLEADQFYKIQFQLEELSNNEPSGDGVTLLGTSYFIVLKNLNN